MNFALTTVLSYPSHLTPPHFCYNGNCSRPLCKVNYLPSSQTILTFTDRSSSIITVPPPLPATFSVFLPSIIFTVSLSYLYVSKVVFLNLVIICTRNFWFNSVTKCSDGFGGFLNRWGSRTLLYITIVLMCQHSGPFKQIRKQA